VTAYGEADTRAKLIDPKLKAAGWGEDQIQREYYFVKKHPFTAGRVYLVGEESKRREPRRADYLLRLTDALTIAILEAKDESHSPDAALEEAKRNARMLDLPFAFSSNGHTFVEFDFHTNSSRELTSPPSPEELWSRWAANRLVGPSDELLLAAQTRRPFGSPAAEKRRSPILHPFCPPALCGKTPRYFQEVATHRVLERVMRAQRRILLTMATGTGKTFVSFQIVWKLRKSSWLQKPVLFITDRIVLRDQAYNQFAPFNDGASDPRFVIEGNSVNLNRDLYFGIYQTLDADDGSGPLYRRFPADFFGLIIIDECHRSGFGKWHDILQHFRGAIHLGMTATPKQTESIDTYGYFCVEEPEVDIDPTDPLKGTWHPPAYEYSLGQGIEDGFLATYKIHKVRTTVDTERGLIIEEAKTQGAEIYVPEGADLREAYYTPHFEREITVPDRTAVMCVHLAGLLRRFGPMQKTMVFCVDVDHARLVARLLQNEFAYLGYPNYAVPVVSEEGDALTWFEQFQDSDRSLPVVASTAELLTTGVDVPSCRNIVFMKTVSSTILFKQIIGRGSRIDEATGKDWFRIIDYVNATRLLDDWDRPLGDRPSSPEGPRTSAIEGTVIHAETGDMIVGASVTLLIGPNEQAGPILTDNDGRFRFGDLPAGSLRLAVAGVGFRRRQIAVETEPDSTTSVVVELRAETKPVERIRATGLTVTIADEATFLVETTGQQLTLEQYLDYTRSKVVGYVPEWTRLVEVWADSSKREAFLKSLEAESIHVEVLGEVLDQPEADQFDLLAHIAFGRPIRTRDERADAFANREQPFLTTLDPAAREVILALLDKYRLGGVTEMSNPEIFRVSPFRQMGQAPGVIRRFGGAEQLRTAIGEVQQRLYRKEA
jgi:type I restriction enzyme R subunit